jgi:hypothetical protein
MCVMRLLLDEAGSASAWGSSLRMLVSLLVMLIALIVAFVIWAKRG